MFAIDPRFLHLVSTCLETVRKSKRRIAPQAHSPPETDDCDKFVTVACPFLAASDVRLFVPSAALGMASAGTNEATREGILASMERISRSYIVCRSLMETPSLEF